MRHVRRQRLRRAAGHPGIQPASDGPGGPTVRPVRRQRLRRAAGYPGIRPASDGPRRAYGAPCAPTAAPPRRRVSWHPASFRRPQEGLRCVLCADSGSAALLCPILTPPPGKFVSADEFEQPTGDPQRLLSFMYNFSDCLKKEFVHKQCTVSDFKPN